MKKIYINNEKGITLIALIITIVVLIILAGITIRLVFSNNGVISRAREAANLTNESAQQDQEDISELKNTIDDTFSDDNNENEDNNDTKNVEITIKDEEFVYNGEEHKPDVNVKDGEKVLVSGTDYDVEYKNNVNAGTAEVIVNLKGEYSGSLTENFIIQPRQATITMNDQIITYGNTIPTLTSSYFGLINGDDLAPYNPYVVGLENSTPVVGSYTITMEYTPNSNYEVEIINGTLTVTAAPVIPGGDPTNTPTPNTP